MGGLDADKLIFREAILDSKAGKPSILDLAPSSRENIIEKFEECCREEEFSCPAQIVFIHVPPKELAARMHERNRKALADGGNPDDKRDGIFPFEQYTKT